MNLEERINSFIILGHRINDLSQDEKLALASQAHNQNSWFDKDSVFYALSAIQNYLDGDKLTNWLANYNIQQLTPKRIAVIMAGNIPLVGFHDFMAVLLAGHTLYAKASTQDNVLIRKIAKILIEINENWKEKIIFVDGLLKDFDAIIATGSNNSARYFEQYFGKYPHIIRKNRSSIAILSGNENPEQLASLGGDLLQYYGLGCRNVSKIFVPINYDFIPMLDALKDWEKAMDNHKYQNNYDYNKSIYLVNRVPHLDTGFLLLTESTQLVSPISVLYYETYEDETDLLQKLSQINDDLQCITTNIHETIVTKGFTNEFTQKLINAKDLGTAQLPKLEDYADGVDTMAFLVGL